jgi:protein-disulfide isomerase
MRKLSLLAGIIVWTLAIGSVPSFAQTNDDLKNLRNDVDALKEGQKAIQNDLQEIKNLLRGRPTAAAPPSEVVLSVEGAPFKGDKNAKLTLVEFTDYQCPFCGRYVRETYPQLERDYISTGKLKYVVRDLPLEAIHPLAFKAAEAAHCAGEQRKYWEMHDRLFANQQALGRPELSKHAEALGLDSARYDQCLDADKYASRIRNDVAEAQKLQANGTPSFFLGLTEPNSSEIKGTRIVGAQPYPAFKAAIDRLLSSQK